MIIKNGLVYDDDNLKFEKRDIYIENNLIVDNNVKLSDNTEINAENKYVIPGLIDTHVHGATGHDFCEKDIESLNSIAKYLKSIGVTAFCPTSMTLEKKNLIEIFKTANNEFSSDCATVVGIHMEGPFISKEKKGAQNPKYIVEPTVSMFKELNEACNNMIKIITMAPEMKDGISFIEEISKDIHVSLGHSTSNYETANLAFDKGADRVTHIFNAMPPFNHREPGIIGAALDAKNIFVELICDGIHVHPSVVRATFKMFGDDHVVLVSDAMMATGMHNGTYNLGGQRVVMKDRKATLEDGTIAGSATNLFECMKKAISFGIPIESAIKSATSTPAKSIGVFDSMGSISAGKMANIIIMDKDLNIDRVI